MVDKTNRLENFKLLSAEEIEKSMYKTQEELDTSLLILNAITKEPTTPQDIKRARKLKETEALSLLDATRLRVDSLSLELKAYKTALEANYLDYGFNELSPQ